MTTTKPLRVAIYSYLPDLAGDELKALRQFIKAEFEKECPGAAVEVESSADPYNLEEMIAKHLGTGDEAYDIMEVDTLLLGDLVKSGKLQLLDGSVSVTEKDYPASAVQAVKYSPDKLYGVPTLQCANFLMEIADVGHTPSTPLLQDWTSFEQLKKAVDKAKNSHKLVMAGDFRATLALPLIYVDAYVDAHGAGSVYQGLHSQLDAHVVNDMKLFSDFGVLPSGKNPVTDGTYDGDKPECHQRLIEDITDSEHILMYAFSENVKEVLQCSAKKKRSKCVLNIVSPPLGKSNHLLTYTDAVVVNKSRFGDSQRADLIKKFIRFYTSLAFRTKIAFGEDLPVNVPGPRYVIPARKDFFTQQKVVDDACYKNIHLALQHSVAAPNHDVYSKGDTLQAELEKALGLPPKK